MSVIFGLLREHAGVVEEWQLRELANPTQRYGSRLSAFVTIDECGMAMQSHISHERSEMEMSPLTDSQRNVVSFDGRLDNYEDLAQTLGMRHSESSDSQIVLRAFERWGEACFSRFTGDWALALWSSADRTLYLARDHAGARTLYLCDAAGELSWSTYIDTFIASNSGLQLSRDYVARYLTGRPLRDLTPYERVRAIFPGHYLKICNRTISRHAHWNSLVRSSIRYRDDADYEGHFIALFKKAVERRTGPGAPVLAQLSGGMDSTSIVCMSDYVRRSPGHEAELIDTVSFYDDSESSFNDREFFPIVESRRAKVGTHLDAAFSQRTFEPHDPADGLYLFPGADSFSLKQERHFFDRVWGAGYGSILSGIGGDEVLGGVPNGFPELAGHLLSGDGRQFFRESFAWSLSDRVPLITTVLETVKYTVRLYGGGVRDEGMPPWVSRSLRERSLEIEREWSVSNFPAGTTPHRIDNHFAWWSIMETMPHLSPGILYRPEYRYPFLDKDLVTFLFSIPRNQLLRPGQRRSLMRRALRNIVPEEILSRRRKAFQLRGPLRVLQASQPTIERLFADSTVGNAGYVDINELHAVLGRTAEGDPTWWQMLLRTIALELWLRSCHNGESVLFPQAIRTPAA